MRPKRTLKKKRGYRKSKKKDPKVNSFSKEKSDRRERRTLESNEEIYTRKVEEAGRQRKIYYDRITGGAFLKFCLE